MHYIFDIFSTREFSLFIWAGLALIATMFSKNFRKGIGGVFKLLFGTQILTILLILTAYVIALIFLRHKLGTWDKSLLKDTIFWFFTVALVLFFTINKAKDTSFFKNTIRKV
jgi:hypothetical protein